MATKKLSVMELVRQKKKDIQMSSGLREKTVKPQSAQSRFRILPGWRGKDDPTFFHDYGQHFVKGTDGILKAIYICSEKTFGKACPVCQALSQGIMNSDSDDVTKAMTESKSKGRILMNALHLDGDDPTTPIILDLTPTTAEKVFELMDEYGDITDLVDGIGIIINRAGKGINTKYSILPAAKSDKVPVSMLDKLHNLDDYVMQEYEDGKVKAIGAVSNISGFLPADRPATPMPKEEDMEGILEGDFDDADAAPLKAEAKPEPDESDGLPDDLTDAEIDDLLEDLG